MNKEKNSGGRIRKPQHGRRLRWGKQFILLAAIAVLALGIVGGTSAYLLTNTDDVTNTFTPGYVSCAISEVFNSPYTTKSDVKVTNTGNTDAYIRAAIIVTWQDEEGNVAATLPIKSDTGDTGDYTIDINSTDWVLKGDGFYYYKNPVAPNVSTANLINSCTVKKDNDPYTLCVEILADAIQSTPTSAVKQAWPNVTVDNNGTLK